MYIVLFKIIFILNDVGKISILANISLSPSSILFHCNFNKRNHFPHKLLVQVL